jgi:hypothetical protein
MFHDNLKDFSQPIKVILYATVFADSLTCLHVHDYFDYMHGLKLLTNAYQESKFGLAYQSFLLLDNDCLLYNIIVLTDGDVIGDITGLWPYGCAPLQYLSR